MKFKKIASVVASAIMLGSTAGMALAANYPEPFVMGGSADAAIVVTSGSHSGAVSDWDAAVSLQTAMQNLVTTESSSTAATASGGDSIELVGPGSNYLNIGEGLRDVYSTDITDDDLPDLLADGTFRNGENTDYDYQQSLTLYNISFSHFADNDYMDKQPSLGFRITRNTQILNYTLDFTKDVESDYSADGIEDLENRDIVMLGKEYRIVQATNDSTPDTDLTLLAGTLTSVLNLNEEETQTVSGVDYTVKLVFVDDDEVQFDVNGERTTKLNKGGIYKLDDGTNIGVKDLSYQSFAGGVMSAEYTLGAEKLLIEDRGKLELDDSDVDEITCYVAESYSNSKYKISSISFEWKADDETYLAPDQELEMPGLESVKFTMGEFYTPSQETIEVNPDGTDAVELVVPIKDGKATLSILNGNGTDFSRIGKDSTSLLRTSANGTLRFNESTDEYFVASYNTSTSAESYLLSATVTQSDNINYTTIKNEVTNENVCEDKKPTETCKIGNLVLTVDYLHNDAELAQLSATFGSGSFRDIYTKEGMKVYLPVDTGLAVAKGNTNITSSGVVPIFPVWFHEEDKDGNVGNGVAFQANVSWSSLKTTVSAVSEGQFSGAQDYEDQENDDVYLGYVLSVLGSKSEFDTGDTQDSIKVMYNGGESYAPVFIAAPAVTVSAGGTTTSDGGQVLVVKDDEVSSVSDSNLIVVGGSCINTAAAKVLDSDTPLCGDDFTAATNVGAGQYLIRAVASPYNADKTAVLVAGYEAADTKNAVDKLKESHMTDVGTDSVYPVTAA